MNDEQILACAHQLYGMGKSLKISEIAAMFHNVITGGTELYNEINKNKVLKWARKQLSDRTTPQR